MFSIKSSPVFGKTAVMECRVKESANKLGENATLYKLNTDSTGDFYDVVRSKNTTCILNDYVKAYKYGNSLSEYYILQDDYTGEVISCAQVSRRYRNSNKENPGNCTFISAMSENKKYLNGAEPILAYMTKVAAERYDKSLYAAYNIKNSDFWSEWRASDLHSIKNKYIIDAKSDGVCIPNYLFLAYLDKVEKRNCINYLV